MNSKVLDTGDANHKNEVSVKYDTTASKNNGDDKTDEDVYTATITIDKVAGNPDDKTDVTGAKLAGAEFKLAKKVDDAEAAEGFYYEYAVINDTTKAVTWTQDKASGTVVTTDHQGATSFAGLSSGTYYLEEVKAPDGYNLLKEMVEVVVAEGENNNANIPVSKSIANYTGTELPATGGIGTTIFTVTGAVLMIGAAILLLTKKRSEG